MAASTGSAAAFVICSTGLSSTERRTLESAISGFANAVYEGDLTSRTTVLIAKSAEATSQKVSFARSLGLPIVMPAWVLDASDSETLEAPADRYIFLKGPVPKAATAAAAALLDENRSPQTNPAAVHLMNSGEARQPLSNAAPPPSATSRNFVREPLPLLREAAVRGEISLEAQPLTEASVVLCGEAHSLDSPTGFLRQHALTGSSAGRAYTLRELIFGLRCASLSHADYFLACVTHRVEPVLLTDKKLLVATVLPSTSGARPAALAGADGAGAAARLLEGPLRSETAAALDGAAPPLAPDERAQLLGELKDAADERARLNAQVQGLAARLRAQGVEGESERSATEPQNAPMMVA